MVHPRWELWQRILILAIAYWAAGRVALLMAIPPGYATAVWPASGIALAGVLLWGWRVLPGIVVGSMLVNFGTTFTAENTTAMVRSVLLPLAIGCGAALQAFVGASLVQRGVGFPNPLNRDRSIVLLLVLGGPVSCVIGATVGVIILWWTGRIPAEAIPFHWWTWWGGDAIGVFLVTPVVLLWLAERPADWPRRPITVSVPLGILTVLVVVLFAYTDARERERVRAAFEAQTEALTSSLESRFDRILEALIGMRSFHGGQAGPGDHAKFTKIATATVKRQPGIQALTWTARVTHEDRAEFETSCRKALHACYEVRELDAAGELVSAGRRPEYYPIFFRHPAPENVQAFGFDVASEADRLEALQRAGETGEPIASFPLAAPQKPGDEKSILVFLAIYRDGYAPERIEDRADAVLGYMIAVLQVRRLVELSWQGLKSEGIDFWFVDESATPEKRLALFRRDAEAASEEALRDTYTVPASLQRSMPMRSAGRQWTLRFVQTPTYTAAHQSLQPWLVLAGGMLFTGLLGSVLLGVTGRSTLVASLVETRTSELARANAAMAQEIGERKQAEESLRQSEERFRQLVEGTRDYAILMLDPRGCVVSWNAGARRINGYDADEIIGRHFSAFYSAQDIQEEKPQHMLTTAERDGRCEDEGWRVRKDGVAFWANVIITAMHDSDGRLSGFLKITRDITERKRAEADLEESRRLVQRIAEAMPGVLFVYDLAEQRNIFVNRRLETMLGYTAAETEDAAAAILSDGVHRDDRSKLDWANEQYQTVEDNVVVDFEYRMRNASGEWRWLETRTMIFARESDGSACQILGTTLDVTQRKHLEQEVVEIAAREQRRIGQELHDGTGQELTGLCMLADNLADALREAVPAEEQLARRIAQGLRRSLAQVRALSRGLIPVEVDAEGLMAALGELTDRISTVHQIRCTFECHEPVPVEDNYSATQLYRIAQEAITNAVKHGQARSIRVGLEANGYYLTLRIADDGVGLASDIQGSEGMGLRIMRYRAGQIGAQFSVRATQPHGTIVVCTLVRGSYHE